MSASNPPTTQSIQPPFGYFIPPKSYQLQLSTLFESLSSIDVVSKSFAHDANSLSQHFLPGFETIKGQSNFFSQYVYALEGYILYPRMNPQQVHLNSNDGSSNHPHNFENVRKTTLLNDSSKVDPITISTSSTSTIPEPTSIPQVNQQIIHYNQFISLLTPSATTLSNHIADIEQCYHQTLTSTSQIYTIPNKYYQDYYLTSKQQSTTRGHNGHQAIAAHFNNFSTFLHHFSTNIYNQSIHASIDELSDQFVSYFLQLSNPHHSTIHLLQQQQQHHQQQQQQSTLSSTHLIPTSHQSNNNLISPPSHRKSTQLPQSTSTYLPSSLQIQEYDIIRKLLRFYTLWRLELIYNHIFKFLLKSHKLPIPPPLSLNPSTSTHIIPLQPPLEIPITNPRHQIISLFIPLSLPFQSPSQSFLSSQPTPHNNQNNQNQSISHPIPLSTLQHRQQYLKDQRISISNQTIGTIFQFLSFLILEHHLSNPSRNFSTIPIKLSRLLQRFTFGVNVDQLLRVFPFDYPNTPSDQPMSVQLRPFLTPTQISATLADLITCVDFETDAFNPLVYDNILLKDLKILLPPPFNKYSRYLNSTPHLCNSHTQDGSTTNTNTNTIHHPIDLSYTQSPFSSLEEGNEKIQNTNKNKDDNEALIFSTVPHIIAHVDQFQLTLLFLYIFQQQNASEYLESYHKYYSDDQYRSSIDQTVNIAHQDQITNDSTRIEEQYELMGEDFQNTSNDNVDLNLFDPHQISHLSSNALSTKHSTSKGRRNNTIKSPTSVPISTKAKRGSNQTNQTNQTSNPFFDTSQHQFQVNASSFNNKNGQSVQNGQNVNKDGSDDVFNLSNSLNNSSNNLDSHLKNTPAPIAKRKTIQPTLQSFMSPRKVSSSSVNVVANGTDLFSVSPTSPITPQNMNTRKTTRNSLKDDKFITISNNTPQVRRSTRASTAASTSNNNKNMNNRTIHDESSLFDDDHSDDDDDDDDDDDNYDGNSEESSEDDFNVPSERNVQDFLIDLTTPVKSSPSSIIIHNNTNQMDFEDCDDGTDNDDDGTNLFDDTNLFFPKTKHTESLPSFPSKGKFHLFSGLSEQTEASQTDPFASQFSQQVQNDQNELENVLNTSNMSNIDDIFLHNDKNDPNNHRTHQNLKNTKSTQPSPFSKKLSKKRGINTFEKATSPLSTPKQKKKEQNDNETPKSNKSIMDFFSPIKRATMTHDESDIIKNTLGNGNNNLSSNSLESQNTNCDNKICNTPLNTLVQLPNTKASLNTDNNLTSSPSNTTEEMKVALHQQSMTKKRKIGNTLHLHPYLDHHDDDDIELLNFSQDSIQPQPQHLSKPLPQHTQDIQHTEESQNQMQVFSQNDQNTLQSVNKDDNDDFPIPSTSPQLHAAAATQSSLPSTLFPPFPAAVKKQRNTLQKATIIRNESLVLVESSDDENTAGISSIIPSITTSTTLGNSINSQIKTKKNPNDTLLASDQPISTVLPAILPQSTKATTGSTLQRSKAVRCGVIPPFIEKKGATIIRNIGTALNTNDDNDDDTSEVDLLGNLSQSSQSQTDTKLTTTTPLNTPPTAAVSTETSLSRTTNIIQTTHRVASDEIKTSEINKVLALQLSQHSLRVVYKSNYEMVLPDPATITTTSLPGFPLLPENSSIIVHSDTTTFQSNSSPITLATAHIPVISSTQSHKPTQVFSGVLQTQQIIPNPTLTSTQDLLPSALVLPDSSTHVLAPTQVELSFKNIGSIYHFSSLQQHNGNGNGNNLDIIQKNAPHNESRSNHQDHPQHSILAQFIHNFAPNQPYMPDDQLLNLDPHPPHPHQSNQKTYETYLYLFDSLITMSQSSLVTNQLSKVHQSQNTKNHVHFESTKTFPAILPPFHAKSSTQLLPVISIAPSNLIQPPTMSKYLINPFMNKLQSEFISTTTSPVPHTPLHIPLPISISSLCSANKKNFDQDSLSYHQMFFPQSYQDQNQGVKNNSFFNPINRFTILCLADGHGPSGTSASNTITQTLPKFIESHIYQLLGERTASNLHLISKSSSLIPLAIIRSLDQVQRLLIQNVHDQLSIISTIMNDTTNKLGVHFKNDKSALLQAANPAQPSQPLQLQPQQLHQPPHSSSQPWQQITPTSFLQLYEPLHISIPYQSTVHFSPTLTQPLSTLYLPAIPQFLQETDQSIATPRARRKITTNKPPPPSSNTYQQFLDAIQPVGNGESKVSQQYQEYDKTILPLVDCGSTVLIVVVDNDDTFFKCHIHQNSPGIQRCCGNAVLYRHTHVASVGDSSAIIYQQQSYLPSYSSPSTSILGKQSISMFDDDDDDDDDNDEDGHSTNDDGDENDQDDENALNNRSSNNSHYTPSQSSHANYQDDIKHDTPAPAPISHSTHSLAKTKSIASLSSQISSSQTVSQNFPQIHPNSFHSPLHHHFPPHHPTTPLLPSSVLTPPLHSYKTMTNSLTKLHSQRNHNNNNNSNNQHDLNQQSFNTPILHNANSSTHVRHYLTDEVPISTHTSFSVLDQQQNNQDILQTALESFIRYHIPELLEFAKFIDFHIDLQSLEQICHASTIIDTNIIDYHNQIFQHEIILQNDNNSFHQPVTYNPTSTSSDITPIYRTDTLTGSPLLHPPAILTQQFYTLSNSSVNFSLLCSGLQHLTSNLTYVDCNPNLLLSSKGSKNENQPNQNQYKNNIAQSTMNDIDDAIKSQMLPFQPFELPTQQMVAKFQQSITNLTLTKGPICTFQSMLWSLFPHVSLKIPSSTPLLIQNAPINSQIPSSSHNISSSPSFFPIFANTNEHDPVSSHLEWTRLQRLRTSVYHRSCDCYYHTHSIQSNIPHIPSAAQSSIEMCTNHDLTLNSSCNNQFTSEKNQEQFFDNTSHPSLRNFLQPHHHMINHDQCPLSYIMYYQNDECISKQHQFMHSTSTGTLTPPGQWQGFIDIIFSPYPSTHQYKHHSQSQNDQYDDKTIKNQQTDITTASNISTTSITLPVSPSVTMTQAFALGPRSNSSSGAFGSSAYVPQYPCDCIALYHQKFTQTSQVTALSILMEHLTSKIYSEQPASLLLYAKQLDLSDITNKYDTNINHQAINQDNQDNDAKNIYNDAKNNDVFKHVSDICINFLHDPISPIISSVLLPEGHEQHSTHLSTTPFYIHTLSSIISTVSTSSACSNQPLIQSPSQSASTLSSLLQRNQLKNGFHAMYPFLWPFLFFPSLPKWLYFFILDHGIVLYPYTLSPTAQSRSETHHKYLFDRFPVMLQPSLNQSIPVLTPAVSSQTAAIEPKTPLKRTNSRSGAAQLVQTPLTNLHLQIQPLLPPPIPTHFQAYYSCLPTTTRTIQHGFLTLVQLAGMTKPVTFYQAQLEASIASSMSKILTTSSIFAPTYTKTSPLLFSNGAMPSYLITKYPTYQSISNNDYSVRVAPSYIPEHLVRSMGLALVTSRSLGHYYLSSKLHQSNLTAPPIASQTSSLQLNQWLIPYMAHNRPTHSTLQLTPHINQSVTQNAQNAQNATFDSQRPSISKYLNPIHHYYPITIVDGKNSTNISYATTLINPICNPDKQDTILQQAVISSNKARQDQSTSMLTLINHHGIGHLTLTPQIASLPTLLDQINKLIFFTKPFFTNQQLLFNRSTMPLYNSTSLLFKNQNYMLAFQQQLYMNQHLNMYTQYHSLLHNPTDGSTSRHQNTTISLPDVHPSHHSALYPLTTPSNIIPTKWIAQHNFFCTHHTLLHAHYTQTLHFSSLLTNFPHYYKHLAQVNQAFPRNQINIPTQSQLGLIFALSEAISSGIDFRPTISSFYSNCNNTTLISVQSDGVTNALTTTSTSTHLSSSLLSTATSSSSTDSIVPIQSNNHHNIATFIPSQHQSILDSIYSHHSIKQFPSSFLTPFSSPHSSTLMTDARQSFNNISILLSLHSLGNVIIPSHHPQSLSSHHSQQYIDSSHSLLYNQPFSAAISNLSTVPTIDVALPLSLPLLPISSNSLDAETSTKLQTDLDLAIPSNSTIEQCIPICSITSTYTIPSAHDTASMNISLNNSFCANCASLTPVCLCLVNQHSYDSSLACTDCIRDGLASVRSISSSSNDEQIQDNTTAHQSSASSYSQKQTHISSHSVVEKLHKLQKPHKPRRLQEVKSGLKNNKNNIHTPLELLNTSETVSTGDIDIYATPITPYTNTSYLSLSASPQLSTLLGTCESNNGFLHSQPFYQYGWLLCDQFGYSVVILDPHKLDHVTVSLNHPQLFIENNNNNNNNNTTNYEITPLIAPPTDPQIPTPRVLIHSQHQRSQCYDNESQIPSNDHDHDHSYDHNGHLVPDQLSNLLYPMQPYILHSNTYCLQHQYQNVIPDHIHDDSEIKSTLPSQQQQQQQPQQDAGTKTNLSRTSAVVFNQNQFKPTTSAQQLTHTTHTNPQLALPIDISTSFTSTIETADFCNPVYHYRICQHNSSRTSPNSLDQYKIDQFTKHQDFHDPTSTAITLTRIISISTETHSAIALSSLASQSWQTTAASDNISVIVASIPPRVQ